MDSGFERRAAERRLRMSGGVARSFEELEAAGAQYWAAATCAERLLATYEAIREASPFKGKMALNPDLTHLLGAFSSLNVEYRDNLEQQWRKVTSIETHSSENLLSSIRQSWHKWLRGQRS
jgi:hypothetical protein